jgi:dCMP deaminase
MKTWDEYFIDLAKASAERSKDTRTKVGAVVVGEDNRIISTGYNGFPAKTQEIWDDEEKHKYVIHAELNAILYAHKNLSNCKIYSTLFPCSQCAKAIVAAGIKEVVYSSDTKDGTEDNLTSKTFFKHCGIKLTQI